MVHLATLSFVYTPGTFCKVYRLVLKVAANLSCFILFYFFLQSEYNCEKPYGVFAGENIDETIKI